MPLYEVQTQSGTFEIDSENEPAPETIQQLAGALAHVDKPEPPAAPDAKKQWAEAGPLERMKMLFTHYPAASVKPYEDAQNPSIHLPRVATDAEGVKGVAAGAVNATAGFVEGLSAPANAPLMATGTALGVAKGSYALARQALAGMAGYFAVDMGRGAVAQAKEAKHVLDDPEATTAEKSAAVTAPILTGAGATLAALGTAFELRPDAHALAAKLKDKKPAEAAEILKTEAAAAKTPEEKTALENAAEALTADAVSPPVKSAQESAGVFKQAMDDNASPVGAEGLKERLRTAQDAGAALERTAADAHAAELSAPIDTGDALPELSPQAQRMYDEHGGVDPLLLARLAGTAGGVAYGTATGKDAEDKLQRAVEFGALGYLAGKFGPRLASRTFAEMPGLGAKLDVIKRQFAGETAPRTSSASEASGDALASYVAAPVAARIEAAYRAGQVLGPHAKDAAFSQKLGAVLVEDRLNAIRQSFRDAAKKAQDAAEAEALTKQADAVGSVIGAPDSPLKTTKDFVDALADPEIKAAIARHKELVQPLAAEMHQKTGGELAKPGLHTDAFVNLKALLGDEEAGALVHSPSGAEQRQGALTNPMLRKTAFGQSAHGTGKRYVLDYDTLARRMVEANYSESAKRDLYAQLERDGLGAMVPVGDTAPDFGGVDAVKIPIEPRGRGERPQNFWVRKDVSGEVINAFDTRGTLRSETAAKLAHALNAVQLTGPTDAVYHTANILAALANAPRAGNVLSQIGAKIPGVNVANALFRLAQARSRYIEKSPEVQQELLQLAKIGGLRPEHSGLISALDKTARLALSQLFDELVASGLAKDTPHARREFLNQIGQYDPRLQGNLERIAKEIGVSPFIVAGKTFNRQAIRALTGAPGVETTGSAASARLWATNVAGTIVGAVVLPAAINYLTTGQVAGRPGTPLGAIDTGEDDANGKHVIVDPQKWTNLRRGARITGLNALLDGLRNDKGADRIGGEMVRDIVWGQAHPWLGPVPTAVTVAASGSSPSGFREAKQLNPESKHSTASQTWENLKGAFEESYPVFGAAIEGKESGAGPITGVLQSLGGAVGMRSVNEFTPDRGRAEAAEEESKRAAVDLRDRAQHEFQRINALPPAQRAEPLLRIRQRDPALFDRIMSEVDYQERGLSPTERAIARLGVTDGSRARFIVAALAQRPAAAEKKAFLARLTEVNVLSDTVAEQISELLDSQKPSPADH